MAPNLEEFNEDELEAPTWLNNEFFRDVLRHSEKSESITIKSLKLSPGTGKGDHFASVMFRGVVDYQQNGQLKQKSLIIKTMPEEEGQKKDLLGESNIFATEIGMYTEVLPKFEKILRAIGDDTVLKAPCLYHTLKPRQLIVFEDIVPLGYSVVRDRPMKMEEVKLAFLKLAKWHAISFKLNKEDPKYFEKYTESIMTMPNMSENEFVTGGMILFIDFLRNTPSLAKYLPYFEAMEADYLENTRSSFAEHLQNPQEDAYYVLCHGDFHFKNMMVKRNATTDKFEDLMLLDFQLSYVGPIVNDVIYAIFMLMTAEMRAHSEDELLYYYFSNFQETLQKIGYTGELPKIVQFREQLMQHKHIHMFLMTTFLPFWYGVSDGGDINEMMQSRECRRSLYDNEAFIKEMTDILPKYLHSGYLEH